MKSINSKFASSNVRANPCNSMQARALLLAPRDRNGAWVHWVDVKYYRLQTKFT